MARADRRGVRSSRTHAAARSSKRDSDLVAIEDTLFFTRLRRHAKWMFVFLALIFGLGFVVFGVGSDQGTGIGDLSSATAVAARTAASPSPMRATR